MRRLLLLSCLAWTAHAGQVRFALVVGANLGEAGEEELVYAEEDAVRLGDVLTRFASVPEENLVLLRGRGVDRVESALGTLRQRIAAVDADETVLFVYYSGHADAQAMHLGTQRLEFKRLGKLVEDTGAKLSVLVVDACRSGELTRVKGAAPAQPFDIRADDRLDSEGSAIITSSAAGEDAQESDRLAGGVFTHHFVVGLLGAADASNDERVTLSEAYRYAYVETLRTTSRARFVQHPTYSFRMRGREDLVVTRLTDTGGMGRFVLQEPGSYVLLGSRGAVLELSSEGPVDVLVEPGAYTVRLRDADAVYETRRRVGAGGRVTVEAADYEAVPYGRSVRKGLDGGRPSAWAATTALEVSGPLRSGLDPTLMGAAGGRVDLRALTLELRARYGLSGARNEEVTLTQHQLGVDVGAYRLFDLGAFAPGFGLRLGGDYVAQRFDTRGEAPPRDAITGRAGAVVRVEYAPLPWLSAQLYGGVDAQLLDTETLQAVPFGGAGLAMYLP